MGSILIIGTSHISRDSIKEIRDAIINRKPDFVAVELDKGRLHSMLNDANRKPRLGDIRIIGVQGYLFTIIGGWLQKKLGNIVGIKPGSDMLSAVKFAHEAGAKVVLIDRDIAITLRRFSMKFGWREKWNLFADLFRGLVLRKDMLAFDIRTVPSDKVIERLMGMMKAKYPGLYQVLVSERNEFMAGRLASLSAANPDASIIAVIGAGHKTGVYEDLQKIFKRSKEKTG